MSPAFRPQQSLRLFNTASRQKEIVSPLEPGKIRMYTCGPTVYNYAHIGNFRTYVFEDLLRRSLKFFGFEVAQAMNLTDVDDKTIRGALAQHTSLNQYTETFKQAFFEDLKTLSIEPVEHYPAATDFIPHMIQLIETLLSKGIAYYGTDGSVYYSIEKFPSYGRLSHLALGELKAGGSERVQSDEYDKEKVADFVLWKAWDSERDGDIYWESPFGRGRPGWHIECSAMAMALLGERLDIHVGGVDNMFPHHENEIAQSEGCTGRQFVRLWLHSEHLLVDHKKMSKSLGNFYTLRDLLQRGYSGAEVRYLLAQTHYRTQLNFTFQGLESARNALQRIRDFVFRLKTIDNPSGGSDLKILCEKAHNDFAEALADDLNVSAALAVFFDFLREVNSKCDSSQMDRSQAALALEVVKTFDRIFAFLPHEEEGIPNEVLLLLDQRQQARERKDWKQSDLLREKIDSCGYRIEDSPSGARLRRKSCNEQ